MSTITMAGSIQHPHASGARRLAVLKWVLYACSVVTALLAIYGLVAMFNLAGSDTALRTTLAFVAPQLSNLLIQLVRSFLVPASLVMTFLFTVNSLLLFAVGTLLVHLHKLAVRVADLEERNA